MTGIPKGVTRVDVLQAIRWSHFLRSDEANYSLAQP